MNKTQISIDARNIFLSEYQAVLSTHSIDVRGYPFGSIVPYCINKVGLPIILISKIAQHTKNIVSNTKVSLIVIEDNADDLQTVGRVTFLGDAELVEKNDNDSAERYYNYFPQSRDYHKTHDFDFYVIKPVRIRFIKGFGQVYWIEKNNFQLANPFIFEEEQEMLNHMNIDHIDTIRHYCDIYNIHYRMLQLPKMVGIDSEGFNLRVGSKIHRIKFVQPVTTVNAVRRALVQMAKKL